MQDLLLNPVVQSAVAPALAAAVVAPFVLRTRALALIPLAGFLAVVALAVGFSLEPTTARAKSVLVVAAGGLIGLGLDLAGIKNARVAVRAALALLLAGAALWVSVRVIEQKQGTDMWVATLAVLAFPVAMAESWRLNSGDRLRAFVAAAALGFTTGALGLLGASSSIALTGIAFGSASGIGLLGLLWRNPAGMAPAFATLAVAVFAVFGGLVASLTGKLPGLALVPLLLIPPAVYAVPRRPGQAAWLDAIRTSAAAFVPAAMAVGLALWPLTGHAAA